MKVAVDWDGCLVDAASQEWLPGADRALGLLLGRGYTVIVHTCRANWPEGRASVEEKIRSSLGAALTARLTVEGKPEADVYIDDRAVPFRGDWEKTIAEAAL